MLDSLLQEIKIMATKDKEDKVNWTKAMVRSLEEIFQCQDAERFKWRVLSGSEEEGEGGYHIKNYKLMFNNWLDHKQNQNVTYIKFK